MTRQNIKWLKSMMDRYETDEAGVSEIMRERQKLAYEQRKQNGPWKAGYNDKELAKQAGRKGLDSRWGTGNTELKEG